MLASSGRPRKACSTCKSQKIRCSGERPICKRCSRLNHTCVYSVDPRIQRKKARPKGISSSAATEAVAPSVRSAYRHIETIESNHPQHAEIFLNCSPGLQSLGSTAGQGLGIPTPLVLTLVDIYFDNVYNASVLLHKRMLLESLMAGTARPHIILSVCAWGANFYRDTTGQPTLKDHGFMIDWAQRASSLVFQEVEEFHEENIATLCNLALFWHSQGSWRKGSLYKGTACNLLSIIGLGATSKGAEDTLQAEIRRRRFWACYLMHCHNGERIISFEPEVNISKIPLPWPEDDFNAGVSTRALTTMESASGNGGIEAELIKVITLWSSVLTMIKTSDISPGDRIAAIHTLDEKLSDWWRKLYPDFRLTAADIAKISPSMLSKIFFINIVYHQSLCALHASIVPLFCWEPSDDTWSSARQLSAQVAFEHARASSMLIESLLAEFPAISSMPGFVAYAAYCGCAIQIPFMWCLDATVKARAQANVRANVKMIHNMAKYWKYSALLKFHVRVLYDIHAKCPIILQNEPKYVETKKLTSFNIKSTNARTSILEYTSILRSKQDGLARAGEEASLRIEVESSANELRLQTAASTLNADSISIQSDSRAVGGPANSCPPPPELAPRNMEAQSLQLQNHTQQYKSNSFNISPPASHHDPDVSTDAQTLDLLQPFFDPQMLDLFSNGKLLDLSQFDTSPISLDYFEADGWSSPRGFVRD